MINTHLAANRFFSFAQGFSMRWCMSQAMSRERAKAITPCQSLEIGAWVLSRARTREWTR
jgi:hypothetical protein